MTKLFAPILAFTCDEIWLAMPHREGDDVRNVVFNTMNKPFTEYALSQEELSKWDTLISVRGDVNGVLEAARGAKRIGKSLEAAVTLTVKDQAVKEAPGVKCPRCWMHSVDAQPETGLCPRCAAVVG